MLTSRLILAILNCSEGLTIGADDIVKYYKKCQLINNMICCEILCISRVKPEILVWGPSYDTNKLVKSLTHIYTQINLLREFIIF